MSAFSSAELEYLNSERRLGRLATSDIHGLPHVTPVGMWSYNAELDTIDVSGWNFASTKKYHNVEANPQASFVVDDLESIDPWRPRAVMVQGPAAALPTGGADGGPIIRITPTTVVSWGLAGEPS